VGVNIHKARRDDQTAGVYFFAALSYYSPYSDDLPSVYRNVALEWRTARSINDEAPTNY